MDKKPIDSFDDLFEPFDLEGQEEAEEQPQPARRTVPVSTDDPPPVLTAETSGVLCPSCGTLNHVGDRHCDNCGARLVRSQMPVAPQPMLRTTAGARALIVLAGVVLVTALLALVFQLVGGNGTAAPTTTEGTDTTLVTGPSVELQPLRVNCSTELEAFPCTALIDGDPTTSWNATDGGIDATITFLFQPPVQITEMWIENLQDEGRFLRNARINGIEVAIDDRPQLHIQQLADVPDLQRIRLSSMRTSSVVVTIRSAYPGIAYGGQEPFSELAVQSITFWGRVTPGE